MNETLKQLLIALIGQAQFDALSEEQVTSFANAVIATEDATDIGETGYDLGEGEYDLTKITDPTIKSIVDFALKAPNAALDQASTDLTSANQRADDATASATSAQGELEGLKRATAIEKALQPFNIVDLGDFMKVVDTSGWVVGADGQVEGLDGVMADLQKSKPHLFKPADTSNPNGSKGGGNFNPPAGGGTPNFDDMSMAEIIAYQRQHGNKGYQGK